MSYAGAYAWGALAIVRRDLSVFISYRTRALSIMFSSVFGVVLFHFVSQLVNVEQFRRPEDYFAYVVIGVVALTVLTSTLSSGPLLIRQELIAGTFERLLVSPFGAVAGIVSLSFFPLLLGLAGGTVTLGFAAIAFGLPIDWSTAPLTLPVVLLGVWSFMPLGLLVSAAVIVMKQAQSIAGLLVTGLSLVAGLYFPVELLPAWLRWASEVQPVTPAVELLRHVLVGAPMDNPWAAVMQLGAFGLVLLPVALAILTAAVELGRRRGTISEY